MSRSRELLGALRPRSIWGAQRVKWLGAQDEIPVSLLVNAAMLFWAITRATHPEGRSRIPRVIRWSARIAVPASLFNRTNYDVRVDHSCGFRRG